MPETAKPVRLLPQTLAAFESYVSVAEKEMEPSLGGRAPFLWSDLKPDMSKQVRGGQIPAEFWSEEGPTHIPDGIIHDWIGATFALGVSVRETLAMVQDYNNYTDTYQPEVLQSRLIIQRDDDFQIFLRLLKKKVITVVLDTYHDVHYFPLTPAQWACHSKTPRICEVEHAGTPKENVLPPDTGYGFLWRLNSYWRFEERGGGVWLECRAISLTRDIPKGLAWIIEPMIRKLPRESLIHTLQATRRALASKAVPPR